MSFPKYPRYKDSGVEWLGEVPEHWTMKPLWTYFRRVKRLGFGGEELLSVYRDFGVIPKSSRADNFNKPSEDLNLYQLVEPGDLVINKMKAWQGSVAISEHRGIVSPAYFVYRSLHGEHSRYLHHLMRSPQYTAGYLSLSKGIRTGQWDLEAEKHSRMLVVQPPDEEQVAIASFIDREAAKIDALITEQQHLIQVLQEKRQTVISHAVTRGLDPDAAMKPSGVEWLGNVPQHWSIERFKWSVRTTKNGVWGDESQQDENDLVCVRVADFDRSQLNVRLHEPTVRNVRSTDQAGRILERGNLLLEKSGGGENQPVGCVVLYSYDMLAVCSNFVARVELATDMDPSFWRYVHAAAYLVRLNTRSIKQTSGIQNLDQQAYFDEWAPYPPYVEQAAIASYLDEMSAAIEMLTVQAEKVIALLQERRTALISAAVTGKIDVRGLAQAEAAD